VTAIGFSIYSYEGIGMIMAVQDVTANKAEFPKLMTVVIGGIATLYCIFGVMMCASWGSSLREVQIITDKLQGHAIAPDWIGYAIIVFFCVNLLFTFPLVIYPSVIIFDNYLFAGMGKTKTRQLLKNINRAVVVLLCIALTLLLGQKLDKFLSILGALTCTPIAFIFPALFHYKAAAETTRQKVTDILIVVVTGGLGLYCGTVSIIAWND